MFVRALLILTFAFTTCVSTPNVIAQDNPAATQKKEASAKKKKIMDVVNENVKDLSSEQKEKLNALQKKAAEKQKAMFASVEITWQMVKQREKAVIELTEQGLTGKELWAKASKSAGYNEKQFETQSKVGKVWNDYRFAVINVLTTQQQNRLPESVRKAHAARVKAEAKKAEAEKK